MIKDKLTEAVRTGLNNIKKGDDNIPLKMRGELEVIVKDRDGNILSYERDHNQVTKLAKMAIIHLLAGEIGTIDQPVDSCEVTAGMRALYLDGSSPNPPANLVEIPSKFDPDPEHKHNASLNADGQLVSGMQFFYDGGQVINQNRVSILSQVNPYEGDVLYSFNYPTKMLFGTGIEAYNELSFNEAYADVILSGSNITLPTAARINGYSSNEASQLTINGFFQNLNTTNYMQNVGLSPNVILTNWYSANPFRCRTLQPATTEPLSESPESSDTAIKGAIKNCYITNANDSSKYNPATKMAYPEFRGYGYPAFIYATRKTTDFYKTTDNESTYYQKNDVFDSEPYETELTYTVVMPAQPVNSNDVTTFYPYNGWILKQAGLFCDSRYMLRSRNNDPDLGEAAFISKVNSGDITSSENAKAYRDSIGGQMLFTRNLSSPIMKTADTEVAFVWHIFITI